MSAKDALVNMGGFLGMNGETWRAMPEHLIVTEVSTYSGLGA